MQPESLERSLREHAFVAGMTDAHIEFLAGCTKNVRFAPGDYLVREGEPADTLLLLRTGLIQLESYAPGRGSAGIETLGSGEVIGWATLFPPHRWHLDARALEPVLAFGVDGQCLRAKIEADHDFGYFVMRTLLFIVHRRLERARLQQLDVYKAEVK
jgi:CRP-like cAMP-binding protein